MPESGAEARPSVVEAVVLAAITVIAIGAMASGAENGFGVFHAPEHELVWPLAIGGAINAMTFSACAFWILPRYAEQQRLAPLGFGVVVLSATNVTAQLIGQRAIIALVEPSLQGASTGELLIENSAVAVAVIVIAALYKFGRDWIGHVRLASALRSRVGGLEMELVQIKGALQDRERSDDGGGVLDVTSAGDHYQVPLNDIVFARAAGNYTEIHTNTRRFMLYGALASFIERLPAKQFTRIHRSFLVNLDHVRILRRREVVLDNGKLPVGATFAGEVLLAWRRRRNDASVNEENE